MVILSIPVPLGFNPYSFGCVAESYISQKSKQLAKDCFNPYSFGCVAERRNEEILLL